MLKHVILASAVAFSVPAFAQETLAKDPAPATRSAPPATDVTEPATAELGTPAEPAAPAESSATATAPAAPAEPAAPAQAPAQAEATAQADQAQPAQAKPADAAQIATIVDQGFPTYNKSGDGQLKPEEFGAWMVALRSATEPAFTGQSAADKEWIGKALAAADTDKSGGVSNAELKGFLAPQAAS